MTSFNDTERLANRVCSAVTVGGVLAILYNLQDILILYDWGYITCGPLRTKSLNARGAKHSKKFTYLYVIRMDTHHMPDE
jgi:hypothetical protein